MALGSLFVTDWKIRSGHPEQDRGDGSVLRLVQGSGFGGAARLLLGKPVMARWNKKFPLGLF